MFLMQVRSPVSSTVEPQDKPFSFQEVSRVGIPDRNSGAATQLVSRLGDVEPPRLPPLYGLHVGAFERGDVRNFAHHGASTLCLLADHHVWFNIEGLQPQAEVGLDAEEGLAHNDKR